MTSLAVKICGLREPEAVAKAVELGASYLGFVFYPPSARSLRPDEAATLMNEIPDHIGKVGVFVDPSDDELDAVLALCPLDIVQLHGGETPERASYLGVRTGLQIMKAIKVETVSDLAEVDRFANAADLLMFDARPPRTPGAIPGGNGLSFDWRLLAGRHFARPWFLAGGLTPENLASAVELLHPPVVDVSSGVERWPGSKDPAKLEAFLCEARRLASDPPSS